MCGRFAMDSETNDLIEEFVLDGNDFRDWSISYSIAPTDTVPIIRERADARGEVTRTVDPAVWDFHPAFLTKSTRPQFNARIETVATNGLWKGAFASSRCLVPMRGYYEWTGEPGRKRAHFVHGEGTLAAAGLYTARKVDEVWQVSTVIVTREARDASGEVHDRMPAFVTADFRDEWLHPGRLDDDGKQRMLAALESVSGDVAATMSTYEVDRRVNNSRTADPHDAGLIEPIAADAETGE